MKRFPFVFAAFLIAAKVHCAIAAAPPPAPLLTSDDAIKALHDGTLPAFGKSVDDALRPELTQKVPNEANITRLATLRIFAKRMADLKPASADESATLEWLIKNPTFGPLLLTALSEHDNPARVLTILSALQKKFGKNIEQFPDLAVAVCVVWDTPSVEGQTPQQSTQAACDIFGFYSSNRRALKYDPQILPWQILTFLADSHATAEDRRWALTFVSSSPDPGGAYFQVKYDMDAFNSGQWGGKDHLAYTLQNLLSIGGVCKDEAYFCTEVSRANGIPATVVTGQCSDGEGFHAWVGLLRINNQHHFVWDFQTARYAEHGFWSGTVIDPQTGEKLADSEVALSAEICNAKPSDRLLSLALTQSLDLLDDQQQRVALCKQAIDRSPGNRQAWSLLVTECLRPETPAATIQEISSVVEKWALKRYDDFAFKVLSTLVTARKPDEQLTSLDQTAKLFNSRPDLQAELAMRKGDILVKMEKPVDALHLYEQILEQALNYGPLALEAMARVDTMLRTAGKLKDLNDHYRIAWSHMAAPEASGYMWTTPWYIMGDRYAHALADAGDKAKSDEVFKLIRARDLSHHDH